MKEAKPFVMDPKVMSMHKELSVKSRVRGDFHARFCERVRVKLPGSTRPVILRPLISQMTDSLLYSKVYIVELTLYYRYFSLYSCTYAFSSGALRILMCSASPR